MTSNPMLNSRVIENVITDSKPMTVQGAINKTMILLAIVVLSGYYTWTLCAQGFADKAMLLATVSAIAGFVLAIIASFNPKSSKITAPAYAVCEGLLVGSVSYMYAAVYEGIVLHAVGITLLTLFVMLFYFDGYWITCSNFRIINGFVGYCNSCFICNIKINTVYIFNYNYIALSTFINWLCF